MQNTTTMLDNIDIELDGKRRASFGCVEEMIPLMTIERSLSPFVFLYYYKSYSSFSIKLGYNSKL